MKKFIPWGFFLLSAVFLTLPAFSQSHKITRPSTTKKTSKTGGQKRPSSTSKGGNKTQVNSEAIKSVGNVSDASGYINGHGYVDLGLTVKWATCNVGASNPSDCGSYYAWGETNAKSTYTQSNSVTYNKNINNIEGTQYDASTKNWGAEWRMPTYTECKELIDKCTWQWGTLHGYKGFKITGPNGNSIFLPASGCRSEDSIQYDQYWGRYWTSSSPLVGIAQENSIDLQFYIDGKNTGATDRSAGLTIRPVSK